MPMLGSMPGLNDFQQRMQIVSRRAIYRSFFAEKISENVELSKTRTTWHCALKCP